MLEDEEEMHVCQPPENVDQKFKKCIGRELNPGLPRSASLLLAGENSTTEPPMLP